MQSGGNKVIVLTGPTASGKSSIALKLSNYLPIEIISADSVQIYRYLNIGSNKVTPEERIMVPHHLIDIANPNEPYSAGDFVRAVVPIVHDILRRGRTPVVVGGCTMWVQWLVHGTPDAPRANSSDTFEANRLLAPYRPSPDGEGDWEGALSLLSSFDPSRAALLCRNDWYRLRRYLEVALSVTVTDTDTQTKGSSSALSSASPETAPAATATAPRLSTVTGVRGSPLSSPTVAPPTVSSTLHENEGMAGELDVRCFFVTDPRRERLYRCIDRRCESMLITGLLREVTDLLIDGWFPAPDHNQNNNSDSGVTPAGAAMEEEGEGEAVGVCVSSKAIGYRQTVQYLCRDDWRDDDDDALLHFLQSLCKATRNYAKRQMHWYRADPAFLWLESHRNNATSSSSFPEGTKARSKDRRDFTSTYEPADDSPQNETFAELLHWLQSPRDAYESAISLQMAAGKAVSENRTQRSKGKIKGKDRHKSEHVKDSVAVAALGEAVDGVHAFPTNSVVENQDSRWSALDPSIRAAEDQRNPALKTYTHQLSGDLLSLGGWEAEDNAVTAWRNLLREADICAGRIRAANLAGRPRIG